MYSNSYKSVRNTRRQKQLVIEEETPEQQEQREIREMMATLDEELEIGILQMPAFHHHRTSSTSSKNSKASKEHPKIVKPMTSPRSPRRHSKRLDSSDDIKIPESPEELEKRELRELLDQLEDEVEIGQLQAPSEFQRRVKPPSTEKKSNQRSENKSRVSSQINENVAKETPEETERREIKELIDQLSEEQEIGILDPSTENRITGRREDDMLENAAQNEQEKADTPSKSNEQAQFEMLSEIDEEKLEIQKLFKELEDEQEEGLLAIPTGPRHNETTNSSHSETETEAEVTVQDTILIEKEDEKSEEESLGLSENSVESADYATLKLPNEHDFEVEEQLRRAEREKLEKPKEHPSQSQSMRTNSVSNEETIDSILDTNASDIDAEPVWHVFRDPTYSFQKEKEMEESNAYSEYNQSQSTFSGRSTRSGRRHKLNDEEEIAQELLISENEKLTILSEEFLSSDGPPDFEEKIARDLELSEKDKELIDTTSTDKITFQTSEERLSRILASSEKDKDENLNSEKEEKTARGLLFSENEKEIVGSTSTSKMTFQTSEERIANALLSDENERDEYHHVVEPEERIANTLLLSENEKVGSQSMSSASSTESLDKLAKDKLNRNESTDAFTQDTLVNEDAKDKLSSTSASSISNQESCDPNQEEEDI